MTWARGALPALPTAGGGVCLLSLLLCPMGTGLDAEAETGFFHCMVSPGAGGPAGL